MADSQPVVTLYDAPMWESLSRERMQLQACGHCSALRYPPGPICAPCGSMDYRWSDLSGGGEILSWVRFHRAYFDDHPPPYNAVAIRFDEGPIVVSNLIGPEPEGEWIGRRVRLAYQRHLDRTQHAFMLSEQS